MKQRLDPCLWIIVVLLAGVTLLPAHVFAHDLITAERAENYLTKAGQWSTQSQSAPNAKERGEAQLHLGTMLDEIRNFLNRDLAAHGKVQGLASNYLVAELARIGAPLAFSKSRNYFVANSGYFRSALSLGLEDALVTQAKLHLLRGEFYDSFDHDPLQTSQSTSEIRDQLALAESLVESVSGEPDTEEVRFIATIVCARAARVMKGTEAARLKHQALRYMNTFQADYPDSLRSAAMPILEQSLLGRQ